MGGLPGLILKATDSQGHYCFTASGIELCHNRRPITAGLKNYEAVSRKQYRKIHERYYDDPIDGKVEIPENAPPRPAETAIWNVLSKEWVVVNGE